MALILCPECNMETSDRAEACPHCGFDVAHSIWSKAWHEEMDKELEEKKFYGGSQVHEVTPPKEKKGIGYWIFGFFFIVSVIVPMFWFIIGIIGWTFHIPKTITDILMLIIVGYLIYLYIKPAFTD